MKTKISKYAWGIAVLCISTAVFSAVSLAVGISAKREAIRLIKADRDASVFLLADKLRRAADRAEGDIGGEGENDELLIAFEILADAIDRCDMDESCKMKLRKYVGEAKNGRCESLIGLWREISGIAENKSANADDIRGAIERCCSADKLGVLGEYAEISDGIAKLDAQLPRGEENKRISAFVKSMIGSNIKLKSAYSADAFRCSTKYCRNAYFTVDLTDGHCFECAMFLPGSLSGAQYANVEKTTVEIIEAVTGTHMNMAVSGTESCGNYVFYILTDCAERYEAVVCTSGETLVSIRFDRKNS